MEIDLSSEAVDTLIHEKKHLIERTARRFWSKCFIKSGVMDYDDVLQEGDAVIVKFGYYVVNPEAAKNLEITEKSVTEFIVLTKKRFTI